MTYQDIIKDLKNNKFRPIYLLHGDEPYYVDLISDYIENHAIKPEEREFNQTILYGKDTDITTILNHVKRYPMMTERQVVIIKEAQDLKFKEVDNAKKSLDPWLNYLESPLQYTILVLCYKHKKFDKRQKMYKAIEKNGLIFESEMLRDDKIPMWVDNLLQEKQLKPNPTVCALIAEYLGNDLSKIANEIGKLALNIKPNQEITLRDIQDNIGISKDFNVFELQNAIGKRNFYKTMQIVEYFGANAKNNPLVLTIGNLASFFTKILKYHYCKDKNSKAVAEVLGINAYFVKDYELAAKNFNLAYCFKAVEVLREYDMKSKGVNATGTIGDGALLKEMILKIW